MKQLNDQMEQLTSTKAKRAQNRETNLAKMMILIVTIFTATNLYQGMFSILGNYDLVTDLTMLYFDTISDLLGVFTSSTNVLIYAKYNEKFRKKFSELFCSCLGQNSKVKEFEMTDTGVKNKIKRLREIQSSNSDISSSTTNPRVNN